MTHIEAFENLVTPLRGNMRHEEWLFLMSRGEMLIEQINKSHVSNPIKQLTYTLLDKAVNIMKENVGKVPSELPEVLTIWSAIDVIEPFVEKD